MNGGNSVIHPPKFSPAVLDAVKQLLARYVPGGGLILDPFAGVGGIHALASGLYRTIGTELKVNGQRPIRAQSRPMLLHCP